MPHECKRLVTELVSMTSHGLVEPCNHSRDCARVRVRNAAQKVYFPCRNLNRTPKSFSPWPRRVAIRYNSFDWVP